MKQGDEEILSAAPPEITMAYTRVVATETENWTRSRSVREGKLTGLGDELYTMIGMDALYCALSIISSQLLEEITKRTWLPADPRAGPGQWRLFTFFLSLEGMSCSLFPQWKRIQGHDLEKV